MTELQMALRDAKEQLADWEVTETEDGYTQEYINGRIDQCRLTVFTLSKLNQHYLRKQKLKAIKL